MSESWLSPILTDRKPLQPIDPGPPPFTDRVSLAAREPLAELAGVRVVLLDVYGTLVISGSGDVGVADERSTAADVVRDAARMLQLNDPDNLPNLQRVREQVAAVHESFKHESSKSPLNFKPEVEILDVWRAVLVEHGRDDLAAQSIVVSQLAAAVEAKLNPTWPMPGAAKALRSLTDRGFRLGIVSNAQVFTGLLVEDLIGGTLGDWFDLNLCFFSNRFRRAKPDPGLFNRVVDELRRLGLSPPQAVYIGNDMLNDVWAANQAGLKTVLFAGDARSLRLRQDHPSCAELQPDVVMTCWDQLLDCFGR